MLARIIALAYICFTETEKETVMQLIARWNDIINTAETRLSRMIDTMQHAPVHKFDVSEFDTMWKLRDKSATYRYWRDHAESLIKETSDVLSVFRELRGDLDRNILMAMTNDRMSKVQKEALQAMRFDLDIPMLREVA